MLFAILLLCTSLIPALVVAETSKSVIANQTELHLRPTSRMRMGYSGPFVHVLLEKDDAENQSSELFFLPIFLDRQFLNGRSGGSLELETDFVDAGTQVYGAAVIRTWSLRGPAKVGESGVVLFVGYGLGFMVLSGKGYENLLLSNSSDQTSEDCRNAANEEELSQHCEKVNISVASPLLEVHQGVSVVIGTISIRFIMQGYLAYQEKGLTDFPYSSIGVGFEF